MFGYSLLDMLLVAPLTSIEVIEGHLLPIDRNCLSCCQITNCWNLEWEQSLVVEAESLKLAYALWLSRALINLNDVIISQEFSVEASNDHELIWGELTHSSSLSGSKRLAWILNSEI